MLKDKDIAGVMAALKGTFTRWHLASAEGPRAAGAQELRASLGEVGAPTLLFPGVAEAWREACKNARDDDKIIVFGSFLTVAAVIREINA
jgi:dihydrofolate synthase/folylpolyglutamate synthase